MEPFNQVFTQVAAVLEAFKQTGKEPPTEIAEKIVTTIADNLVSQTYLSGISDILNAIEDPNRYAGSFLERTAASFVPASSFLRSIARIVDPTVRDPEGATEAILASIPGLSFSVPAKRNIFGEEITRKGIAGEIQPQGISKILGSIFPVKISKEALNTVGRELERLDITIGFPQETKFKAAGGKEYGRAAADEFLKDSGGYMKQWLFNFMSSNDYANLDDNERAKAIEKIKDLSRDEFRNKIIAAAYLLNEKSMTDLEDQQKLFDDLYSEGIINSDIGVEIDNLRGSQEPQMFQPTNQSNQLFNLLGIGR